MKANRTMRGRVVSNHRRKDKESERSIDSAAHNQILKQQQQKYLKWQDSPHTCHY
jgi:hypothetical protein